MAQSQIGIYKTELIHPEMPGGVDHVGMETLHWVHWSSHGRTHESIDDLTPIGVEQAHYATRTVSSRPGETPKGASEHPGAAQ